MPDAKLKPSKPYADFPLTPHNSGKWAKKIKGRLFYFGKWDDPDGAVREFNAVKDALLAGRSPVVTSPQTMTVLDLFNDFLNRQLIRVDAGRLEARSYQDARGALQEFARVVGPTRRVADLAPQDFSAARESFAKHLGPHALNRAVSNVRTAFNYGFENAKIGQPVYGSAFAKESIRVRRRHAREKGYTMGAKLFTPLECREIVANAKAPLKAMILLGINAGFYAVDVASLPRAAIDLDGAWLEFPRTKTEVMRKATLWPETVAAIRDALKIRPPATNDADANVLFVTKYGNRWVHNKVHRGEEGITKVTRVDAVNVAFKRLLQSLGIHRPGVNFSALRSTFRTIANETGDQHGALLIMGHAFPGMDEFYVRDVAAKRLKRVTDHVRRKLLNPKKVRAAARKKPANRRRKS